jgi:hypothetical protein
MLLLMMKHGIARVALGELCDLVIGKEALSMLLSIRCTGSQHILAMNSLNVVLVATVVACGSLQIVVGVRKHGALRHRLLIDSSLSYHVLARGGIGILLIVAVVAKSSLVLLIVTTRGARSHHSLTLSRPDMLLVVLLLIRLMVILPLSIALLVAVLLVVLGLHARRRKLPRIRQNELKARWGCSSSHDDQY